VAAFVTGLPKHCDASLEVKTAAGDTMEIVIPAAARRGTSGFRELQGADACFTGVIELAQSVTRVRVDTPASIRVSTPSQAPIFGSGVADGCVSTAVTAPRILRDAHPRYTSEALRARVQGVVILEGVVDATGTVIDAHVTRPLHSQLDQEALKALREWKFAPGTLDGKPVAVLVSVEMTFSLRTR
jgi:TonB family protein